MKPGKLFFETFLKYFDKAGDLNICETYLTCENQSITSVNKSSKGRGKWISKVWIMHPENDSMDYWFLYGSHLTSSKF